MNKKGGQGLVHPEMVSRALESPIYWEVSFTLRVEDTGAGIPGADRQHTDTSSVSRHPQKQDAT